MSLENLLLETPPEIVIELIHKHFPDYVMIKLDNPEPTEDSTEEIEEIIEEPIEKYERDAEIMLYDLYLSAKRLDTEDLLVKKKVLMHLMRYIDTQLAYIRQVWPKSLIKNETIIELSRKYEAYDDMYDELLIM